MIEGGGVTLGVPTNAKEGEPLRRFDYHTTAAQALTTARATLNCLSGGELDTLVQALVTLTQTMVYDGTLSRHHHVVLDAQKPVLSDFFTAGEAYLSACKKSELAEIASEFGYPDVLGGKKSEIIVSLLRDERIGEFIPQRLRPEADASVQPDPDEAPFDEDEPENEIIIDPGMAEDQQPVAA